MQLLIQEHYHSLVAQIPLTTKTCTRNLTNVKSLISVKVAHQP